MKNYVGIDLGTTNSAICSYDGNAVKIHKSREQNSVTPSAFHIDRRGNWHYGLDAYKMKAQDPANTATLFKRYMGTSTPIEVGAKKMTPEECSAELLKVLFGYLPDDIRNVDSVGTVITVPAAFNQMQRDATMSAAQMAGIGKTALMQEPVAAVMSVMRTRKHDGIFLVYDLGGGTFDIALAQSISGRVSLLEHGGITMCGGRDWDTSLRNNIVIPWLFDNFDLPENLISDQKFGKLLRIIDYAAEKAKIELSGRIARDVSESVVISAFEEEIRLQDLSGKDIFIEVPFDHNTLNELINERIVETINATREVLSRAHLTSQDIDRVVFVGGPTQYKPLRELVSFELAIPGDTQVDPMTSVAEGAAVFAESIDWSTESRGRKSTRGSISSGKLNLSFEYISRTPDIKARIAVKSSGSILSGTQFQVDSLDTGWSSGRMELKNGASLEVMLSKNGENNFKVFVFDPQGGPISLEHNLLVITRTAATIDGIPASHSIGVEVKESVSSNRTVMRYLIRKGESLPKKGTEVFKTTESLRAGGPGSIIFNLYEGEIEDPVTDNWPVGAIKITGKDFDAGIIQPGDDLNCEYEVSDSGRVSISITAPKVGATFDAGHEFYSRIGAIDYSNASELVADESESVMGRVEDYSDKLGKDNDKLDTARTKLAEAQELAENKTDPEATKQAMENVQEAKRILAQVKKENLKTVRQSELESCVSFFQETIRQYAKSSEITSFDNMAKAAQRAVNEKTGKFEDLLSEMRSLNWQVLWRQDWFVVDTFQRFAKEEFRFTDRTVFTQLVQVGNEAMKRDDMDQLRQVVNQMYRIRVNYQSGQDIMDAVNIM